MAGGIVRMSENTAARLREVLAASPGLRDGGWSRPLGPEARFVRVTGAAVGGFYPCVPTDYITLDDDWEDYEAGSVIGANGETLTDETNYLALRVGNDSDDEAVYVAVVPEAAGSDAFDGAIVYADASQSAQSIAGGAWTALNFYKENIDTGSYHDNTTNNQRITIGGNILAAGHVQLNGTGNGNFCSVSGRIIQSSDTQHLAFCRQGHQTTNTVDFNVVLNLSGMWASVSGYLTFEVLISWSGGGNMTVETTNGFYAHFSARRWAT